MSKDKTLQCLASTRAKSGQTAKYDLYQQNRRDRERGGERQDTLKEKIGMYDLLS